MKTLTVHLDASTIEKLAEEAARRTMTLEQLAAATLSSWARGPGGMHEPVRAWAHDHGAVRQQHTHGDPGTDLRTTPEDYDGPYVELDQALDAFSAELTRRLKSPAG